MCPPCNVLKLLSEINKIGAQEYFGCKKENTSQTNNDAADMRDLLSSR